MLEPERIDCNGITFFSQNMINRKIPEAPTRQEYLVTLYKGNYIIFVISYDSMVSEDYKAMRKAALSFSPS